MTKKYIVIKYLYRYTKIPCLQNILNNRVLTLKDQEGWEDTNDVYFIEVYKRNLRIKSVLTLCFAQYKTNIKSTEKYHHWKIYSGDTTGVCIQFNKNELITHCQEILGNSLHCGKVLYKKITTFEKDVDTRRIQLDDLPFIKRIAFNDEREYRFIYNSDEYITRKDIPISISNITRIIFNPWISIAEYNHFREEIRNIKGCKKINVQRSTCLDSERWKNVGDRIAKLSETK
jgi:hypothetical protein